MEELIARAIRQDARTCQLLGVDFVPVAIGAGPSEDSSVSSAPEASAQAEIESSFTQTIAKPVQSRPKPPVSAPAQATITEPKPAEQPMPTKQAPRTSAPKPAATGKQAALDALRAKYEADAPHQHFVTAHTNIVFGDGSPEARLMFVGEAPGADEDREGIPFVGRAGQLLNKMIEAMGLSREEIYIANVLKTRPPGNATPTSEEALLCAPYLYGQIGIIKPEVIVTLGLPATRLLLDSKDSMGRLRANWRTIQVPEGHDPEVVLPESVGHEVQVMPTYHPAYLLRSYTKENREKVWSDLQQVMTRLGKAAN